MPKIKIDHVVTFSSEDNVHVASNILINDMTKKWKTKGVGEPAASIVLQLDRVTKISGVDICNECSSFVEVLVGRSSSQGEDYQPLVIMSSFMSPMEARDLRETNRVRIFAYKDLVADIRDEKWDRVKFNCTQPFNKNIQYGLSYITLYSPQEEKNHEYKPISLGKFTLRPESPDNLSPGSLFNKRSEKKESLTEQIKKITSKEYIEKFSSSKDTTPKITPKNNNSSHKTSSDKPSTSRNRNSIDLFYESDDDKKTDKIDRLIAHQKHEDELKKKADESKKKDKNESTTKRNIDKVEESPRKTDKESKKKNVEPKVKKQCVKKVIKKPFDKLLSGVVFTISGIINPERANLREKALELGAKYKPSWDNHCTHLICAFANTPKFREVQGKGKIVKKNWVFNCYEERKRLPWRRYALDTNDQGIAESEDEIFEDDKILEEEISPQQNANISGSDTEDEVERILLKQKEKQKKEVKVNNDPFEVDTDEEKLEKIEKPITKDLPKIFDKDMFYVDDVFDIEEKQNLEKLITILNGYVLDQPRIVVDYIITNEESAEEMKEKFSDSKIASTKWIYDMYNNQKLLPINKYKLI